MDQHDELNESRFRETTVAEKLKRPESAQLREKILNFIRDVQQDKYPQDKLSTLVTQKIEEFEDDFQALWQENEEIVAENGEAFEKIVTKPLFSKLMPIDTVRDKSIEFALKIFDFIQLKHLEIDESVEKHPKFSYVVQQIAKIDSSPTPREKLACMINACKWVSIIVNSLSNNVPTGADNFLPVLIYATIRAQPERSYSNIQYISLYRAAKRITGPEEYYFTAYESTLEFIEQLDQGKLKISSEEYNHYCQSRASQGIQFNEINIQQQSTLDVHQNYVNLQMIRMKISDLQKKSRFYENSKKMKLKFSKKQLSEISLSEVNEFYQEYHILYANLLGMQKDLDSLHSLTENAIKESISKNKQSQTKKFFGLI